MVTLRIKSLMAGLLFSTITTTNMYAAPFFCQANSATLTDKVLCDTLCGSACQELLPNTANLNTCDTSKYNNFIGLNGKTYALTKDQVWWEDVRSTLAIVKDDATNTIFSKLISSESYIGVYDPLKSTSYNQINPSRFKDKEGSILGYSNWDTGEPNNYLTSTDIGNVAIAGEHWTVINSTGKWSDIGYHVSNGGDYKPRRNAIVEWSSELACVSGITEHTTSDKTGFWCSSVEGNVAQCIVKTGTETPTCSTGTWNTTTQKCESGGTTLRPADVELEFKTTTTTQSLPWLPPTVTTSIVNTLKFYDAHFSCGNDWEMDSQFQIDKSTGNLKLDVLIDRCGYYGHLDWKTWTYIPNNPNSITWYEDQHVGPSFTVTKNIDASISLYRNGVESNFIEWYTGGVPDEGIRGEKMSIRKVYSCLGGALSGTTCTVSTLVKTDGQCSTPGYTIQNGQCVGTYQGCPLGNYACTDITGNVTDTDVAEGTNDAQNDGEVDENGKCLGTIHIFSGRDDRCRPSGIQTGGTSCCNKGTAWFGLKECTEAEKALGKMREYGDLDGNCHKVGTYCSEKWPVIGCVQKKETYCCFSSPLARTMHEGGRPQLGISWGTPENPSCRGFTIEEFQKIDFSKIDFSEWIKYELPNVQQGSITNIKNTIGNIKNVSTSTGQ